MYGNRKSLLRATLAASAFALAASSAGAQDAAMPVAGSGWFADVGAGAAFRFGDSNTTNGGALFSGTVSDVEFDPAFAIGGRIGYAYSSAFGVFLSYDYVDGDVGWRATFPGPVATLFDGRASSHIVLANVQYSMDISSSTRFSALAGAGLSINQLRDVVEINPAGGALVSNVEDGTTSSFAARAGVELAHDLTDAVELKLGANLEYYGDFETGSSRVPAGGGQQPIGGYELTSAWGASVTTRVVWKFN